MPVKSDARQRWLFVAGLCLGLSSSCASSEDTPDDADGGMGGSDAGDTTLGTPTTTAATTASVTTGLSTSGTATSGGKTSMGGMSSGSGTTGGAGETSTGTTDTTGFGFGPGNAVTTGTSTSGSGGNSSTTSGETTSAATTGSATTGGVTPLHKFVGNITTGRNSVDTNDRTYSDYWDQITPENAGKWGSVQSNASSDFNWSALDAIYDYAQQSGIIFKQHTFLWGSQQPGGNIGEADVKRWMTEFCARYPNTPLIDVVNEPPPHTTPAYDDSIGGGTNGNWQWIVNAFNWAREACPDSVLILNDYNNIEWGDQNQHFIDIVKTIQNAGAPIDAVGCQAHGLTSGVSTDTMKNLITKLHNDTGLPVYITEYDIAQSDDQAQLGKYQEHMPFFLETEWIHGITVWGWIYGSTWVQGSGLIRDGSPRPAMTWLMQELGRPQP